MWGVLGGDEVYAIQVKLSDTGISVTRVIREHLEKRRGLSNDQTFRRWLSHVERVIRRLGEEAAGVYRSNEQPVAVEAQTLVPQMTRAWKMPVLYQLSLLTITKHSRKRIDEADKGRAPHPPPHILGPLDPD